MKKRLFLLAADFVLAFSGLALLLVFYFLFPKVKFDGFSHGILTILALCLLLVLTIIEFFGAFTVATSSFATAFLAVCFFLSCLFSPSMAAFIKFYGGGDYTLVFDLLSKLGLFFVFPLGLFYLNSEYDLNLSNFFVVTHFVVVSCLYVAYIGLTFYGLQNYVLGLFAVYNLALSLYVFFVGSSVSNNDPIFFLTCAVFAAAYGILLVDLFCSISNFWFMGYLISALYFLCIILEFVFVYAFFVVRVERRVSKAYAIELENTNIKSYLLKEQIKPHFIFNVLSRIKSSYRVDLDQGDHLVDLFSRHLRNSVLYSEKDLVSFDEELDNTLTYVELINLGSEHPFDLVMNINYSSFKVPLFSIEPFVENSIKYSMVNKKEGGFIEISSSLAPDGAHIKIIDNGVGFDTNNIGETSVGLKNCIERLRLTMNAKTFVTSKRDVGTIVEIVLPKAFCEEE